MATLAPPKPHRFSIRDLEGAKKFIARRHVDYRQTKALCDWILDTLEGGEQYKRAEYEVDGLYGAATNLIRHRREWPLTAADLLSTQDIFNQMFMGVGPTGQDPTASMMTQFNQAAALSYETRLMRTPTPSKFRQILSKHIAQIYKQTPRREAAAVGEAVWLKSWWNDVDGRGTDMNEWMRETVAPLLIALGYLDIYCDHPGGIGWSEGEPLELDADDRAYRDAAPDGMPYLGMEGERAAVLERCHAQVIMPQNVLWYRLDYTERYYTEVLIKEYQIVCDNRGQDRPMMRFRHWTREGWTLYDVTGAIVDEDVHPFKRVPIERVYDRRHPRIGHVGDPRFRGIVEKSREYFNEESELIYAMDLQCFAFLQAPPIAFNEAADAMAISPGIVAYRIPNPNGGPTEGYDYVAPPLSPLEFLMERLNSLDALMDEEAGLSHPNTAVGKAAGTTQPASGISKSFDQEEGNNILAGLALALQSAESVASEIALCVHKSARPTNAEMKAVEIQYTTQFNLLSYDQMTTVSAEYLDFRDRCGETPLGEGYILRWYLEFMVRGVDPKIRVEMNKELDEFVLTKKTERAKALATATAAAPGGGTSPPPPAPQVGNGRPAVKPVVT